MEKTALNYYPLHTLLKRRWSPTVFEDKALDLVQLGSLFEAARWSASCFNEQPWNFVIASRHSQPEAFQKLVACLTPGNAAWAKKAPLLMFSVAKLRFDKTGELNRYAWYDSGQALAHLSIQAMDLGIFVHQMAGFDAVQATSTMRVPPSHEVVCAVALGYGVGETQVPVKARDKENAPRDRRLAEDFVHHGTFRPGPFKG